MDNITFEQLPQAVSLLIEKVGQLSSRIEDVLKRRHHNKPNIADRLTWTKWLPCLTNRLTPSMP